VILSEVATKSPWHRRHARLLGEPTSAGLWLAADARRL